MMLCWRGRMCSRVLKYSRESRRMTYERSRSRRTTVAGCQVRLIVLKTSTGSPGCSGRKSRDAFRLYCSACFCCRAWFASLCCSVSGCCDAIALLLHGSSNRGLRPKSISYGDGVLLSIGVIRCIQRAVDFDFPSSPSFFQRDFTIPIERSAMLFDWW